MRQARIFFNIHTRVGEFRGENRDMDPYSKTNGYGFSKKPYALAVSILIPSGLLLMGMLLGFNRSTEIIGPTPET